MIPDETARAPRAVLLALLVVAAAGRIGTALYDVPAHIDEYLQYLEPARWRLHGAGFQAWEYDVGLRSWVLPGYHGAWMAALEAVGVVSGWHQHAFLRLHWAAASLLLVWAAWAAGKGPRSSAQERWVGGLVAAGLTAVFPFLVRFAPRTLTENPSMIALVGALALSETIVQPGGERRRGLAFLAGALVGFACCIRVTNAPLVLVFVAWMLAARRPGALGWGVPATALVVAIFGLVDRLTWGSWFASYTAYVRFNFLEGKAAQFGTQPPLWYCQQLWNQAGVALPVLVLLALTRLRATWPYLLGAALLVVSLSTQAHKEVRFIVLVWPLLFIAAGRGAGLLLAARPAGITLRDRWRPGREAAVAALGASAASLLMAHSQGLRCGLGWDCRAHEVQTVQAWVARQPELEGLVVDNPWLTAGYFYLPAHVPMVAYEEALLANPVFDHLLAAAGSDAARAARAAGFVEVHRHAGQVVLRR